MELTKQRVYVKIGDELLSGETKTVIVKSKNDVKGRLLDGREVEKKGNVWVYKPY